MKAQSSIEFMILIGFVLFFFASFFLIIQENTADKLKQRQNLIIEEIALTVRDEINFALESSDGYFREFEIPEKAGNQAYDLQIVDDMIYVKTSDEKFAIAIPVAAVNGQIDKGTNKIEKQNGEVYLNA